MGAFRLPRRTARPTLHSTYLCMDSQRYAAQYKESAHDQDHGIPEAIRSDVTVMGGLL
jgi:hypothetical protein